MFIVSQLHDTIAIDPRDHLDLEKEGREHAGRALEMEINKKYINKVFPDLGLCVCLFSVLDSSEGVITFGDGRVHHKVLFELVVFKPAFDEILVGRVKTTTAEGIGITLGFFDNIWVNLQHCPQTTRFEKQGSRLYWAPDIDSNDTETEPENKLYINEGDPIRFRCLGEEFDYGNAPSSKQKAVSAYKINASIEGPGCGLTEWW